MDQLVSRIQFAFSFERPSCVVIHPGNECFDCRDVADTLDGIDSNSVLETASPFFATIPIDCMTAVAFLHYLPAIARESLAPEGQSVAETVAWVLGADDWETDKTISEHIKPLLNTKQTQLIRELLTAYTRLRFSPHGVEQLGAALELWAE
jgi:hypothetical protein